MCMYCVTGDTFWKYDPPFQPKPSPLLPNPVPGVTINPWDLTKLYEYKKLLEDIKALEDQVGCPCDPNKADHIQILKDRITDLEKKATDLPKP